jgi:hypothetical protein
MDLAYRLLKRCGSAEYSTRNSLLIFGRRRNRAAIISQDSLFLIASSQAKTVYLDSSSVWVGVGVEDYRISDFCANDTAAYIFQCCWRKFFG